MTTGFRVVTSKAVATEYTWAWIPNIVRPNTIPVLLSHGAGALDGFSRLTWPKTNALVGALVQAGIPAIAHQQGGDLWANDTVMSRLDAMLSYIASQTGCRSDKAHHFGISMGGGASLRYASLNPAKVATVTANIPMVNLPYMYQNDVAAIRTGSSPIHTAWGLSTHTVADFVTTSGSTAVTSASGAFLATDKVVAAAGVPAGTAVTFNNANSATLSAPATASATVSATLYPALPAGADLLNLASAIKTAAIPGFLNYSTVDAYIRTTDVQTMATNSGLTAVAVDSASGHADGTIGKIDVPSLINFLIANGS